MGTRTFVEAEGAGEPRADLYGKMVKQAPDAPSETERDVGRITKLRYLRFRDEQSTTTVLGYRIDALKVAAEVRASTPSNAELKRMTIVEDTIQAFAHFIQRSPELARRFLVILQALRTSFAGCAWSARHAFIRTSLLFCYDSASDSERGMSSESASVRMIDLAHVYRTR